MSRKKDGFTGWMSVCGHWTYLHDGRVCKVIAHYGAFNEGVIFCIPFQYSAKRNTWYPCHSSLPAYSRAFQRGLISLVALDSLSDSEKADLGVLYEK